jgi:hypothetical protein
MPPGMCPEITKQKRHVKPFESAKGGRTRIPAANGRRRQDDGGELVGGREGNERHQNGRDRGRPGRFQESRVTLG